MLIPQCPTYKHYRAACRFVLPAHCTVAQWFPERTHCMLFSHIQYLAHSLLSSFQDSDLLTFNISAHHSWWSEHGPGCVRNEMQQAPGVRTTESHSYITVMGCLIDYQYIEVVHSGGQILVAVSRSCRHTHTHVGTRGLLSVGFLLSKRWTKKVERQR